MSVIRSIPTAALCFFLTCLPGLAQQSQSPPSSESPSQQDLNVGFMEGTQIIFGTEEGKAEIAEIQTFIQEMQKQFDVRQNELDALRQQFETQRATLNPQTGAQMQGTIEQKDRELKRFQEDTQLEIDRRRDRLTNSLREKSGAVVEEFAQRNKLGVIFLLNESMIYVDTSKDLTPELIQIYNQKHPPATAPQSQSQP